MKFGIIGSAAVGQVLAKAFKNEGHDVVLGTRNPEKKELEDFKSKNAAIEVKAFEDTASWAELIVIATAGKAV